MVDSSAHPSTIYAGTYARSSDGGVTWSPITQPSNASSALAADHSGTLYAASQDPNINLYVSRDHGASWQEAAGSPVSGPQGIVPQINAIMADPASAGVLYAILQNTQTSAFVTKLSPDGSQIVYSTFLHGNPSVEAAQNTGGGIIWVPTYVVEGPNYATGIALDPKENIVVTGATRSTDFFVVNPWQSSNKGQYDAFAAIISADGDWLYYSTYLGGGLNDAARAIAVDSQGNLIVAGQTYSGDFPVVNAAQPKKGNVDDAFVMKITPHLPPGISNQ